MKKLQNRLILVIVTGILIATLVSGVISLLSFISVGEERSTSILNNELKLSAAYINETFTDVEKFTHTLSDYYLENCPDPSKLTSAEGTEYMNICKALAMTLIKDNEILCATYFRLAPELVNSGKGGFFLSATSDNHSVTEQLPTDILAYEPDDISHVGWYYIPVAAEKPIWMDEYFNENNGILMISYVAPLYLKDGTLLGVVGIDINMTKVYKHYSSIRLYDTGFEAIMSDTGEIKNTAQKINLTEENKKKILNSNSGIQLSYVDRQQEMTLLSEKLNNGDYLLLAIQNEDLYKTENRTILTVIIVTALVCSLVILFLTKTLFQIFNEYKTDKLTKVENRNSYLDEINEIDHAIKNGKSAALSVIVFDVNGLKQTNDKLGHNVGDKLLKEAVDVIKNYFPGMTVFRIGGDEFVICSMHSSSAALNYQFEKFRGDMAEQARNCDFNSGTVFVSSGIATFDAKTDHCYDDVFKRADKDMYADKRKFYQSNSSFERRTR